MNTGIFIQHTQRAQSSSKMRMRIGKILRCGFRICCVLLLHISSSMSFWPFFPATTLVVWFPRSAPKQHIHIFSERPRSKRIPRRVDCTASLLGRPVKENKKCCSPVLLVTLMHDHLKHKYTDARSFEAPQKKCVQVVEYMWTWTHNEWLQNISWSNGRNLSGFRCAKECDDGRRNWAPLINMFFSARFQRL